MKKTDVNDTLRDGGPDAVRARHDRAKPHKPNGKETQAPRFRLVPFREIKISTAPAYLVKGIIPRCGLVVTWGPPKCGKSFWTLDLTMHVALGWSYRGRRVQQGPIVYLALEGGLRFNDRVEAWRRKHLAGHSGEVPFYLLGVPVDIIADHPALISAIAEQLADRCPSSSSLTRSIVDWPATRTRATTWRNSSAPPTRSARPSARQCLSSTIAASKEAGRAGIPASRAPTTRRLR
jgi:hypothetical protein